MPRTSILVIDDSPDVADALALLLRLQGYDARPAYGGAEGLSAALACPPDVALIDLTMPDLDGFEVARRLRAEPTLAGVRLVAMSAHHPDDHAERARLAGFDACRLKRAEPADLVALLRGLAELRHDRCTV